MKTAKLKYLVSVYDDDKFEVLLDQITCITLAEARLEASRHSSSVIVPVGVIYYRFGKEFEK